MHDQWMISRAPFGGKYLCHRIGIAGISTQPIYRFSGQRDKSAGIEQIKGMRKICRRR
jgi:hypothetical protein